jgi:bifunctional non-homologous end joining protein LigD
LTIEDLTRLRWLKPQLVIQVGFVEWTMHGHLRHPTFIGLRTDKAPRDVVRER